LNAEIFLEAHPPRVPSPPPPMAVIPFYRLHALSAKSRGRCSLTLSREALQDSLYPVFLDYALSFFCFEPKPLGSNRPFPQLLILVSMRSLRFPLDLFPLHSSLGVNRSGFLEIWRRFLYLLLRFFLDDPFPNESFPSSAPHAAAWRPVRPALG